MRFELVWSNKIRMYILVSFWIPYCILFVPLFISHFFPPVSLSLLSLAYFSHSLFFTTFLSVVSQMVQNLSAVQETWVQSLGWKAPLEKEMATHSSILARRIPWTEEPGGLQSVGLQRVGHNWVANTYTQWFSRVQDEVAQSCPILYDPMDSCPPGLLHPWDSPGKNTGVGCHFLLQGIFPTQGLDPDGDLHCRQMLYPLSYQGSSNYQLNRVSGSLI